jgi:hypothetical protein
MEGNKLGATSPLLSAGSVCGDAKLINAPCGQAGLVVTRDLSIAVRLRSVLHADKLRGGLSRSATLGPRDVNSSSGSGGRS